ncbi:hypothetical protein JCM16814_08100 [Desulfobaculum senezii]
MSWGHELDTVIGLLFAIALVAVLAALVGWHKEHRVARMMGQRKAPLGATRGAGR